MYLYSFSLFKIKNIILKRLECLLKNHPKITQCSSIVIFLEEFVKQLWIIDVYNLKLLLLLLIIIRINVFKLNIYAFKNNM